MSITSQFQSTLPVWGGTRPSGFSIAFSMMFQSTLPVWGGTLPSGFSLAFSMMFQSTLPVWGGTPVFCRLPATRWRFNPPSPCGEGPGNGLRQGLLSGFNPPSPCGEGLKSQRDLDLGQMFQSTLPVWGGTIWAEALDGDPRFQSTLPVWGGTPITPRVVVTLAVSIHPPRVGRDPVLHSETLVLPVVSIHPPRVGRDSKSSQKFFVNFCARRQYYQNF